VNRIDQEIDKEARVHKGCRAIQEEEEEEEEAGLRAGGPGFDFRECKIFLFSTAYRQTVGPTRPLIHLVSRILQWGKAVEA
jgi:hypothetical protein